MLSFYVFWAQPKPKSFHFGFGGLSYGSESYLSFVLDGNFVRTYLLSFNSSSFMELDLDLPY